MAGSLTSEEIWNLLTSRSKLDRDKGIARLEILVKNRDGMAETVRQKLSDFRIRTEDPWETKLGILTGHRVLVEYGCRADSKLKSLSEIALSLLTDQEVRVRLAAGELLGALCKAGGVDVYEDCKGVVMQRIREDLTRGPPQEIVVTSSKAVFHETSGWRNLETSMKGLQHMVEGLKVLETVDPEILLLLLPTTRHENRFVRETGFYTVDAILASSAPPSSAMDHIYSRFGERIADSLEAGMADNWSQVRLAATTAARRFLTSLPPPMKNQVHPKLLPCLCLNRYYLAEGVRTYSQETWKTVTSVEPGGGRQAVTRHLDHVVRYYVQCTKADNHAVREAACQCIAELAAKVDKEALDKHVDRLLDTLVECFNDDSWPVRDMACVASGKFVLSYPAESKRCQHQLQTLFFANLQDPIPTVRQDAAAALKNLLVSFPDEEALVDDVFGRIEGALAGVRDQAAAAAAETSSLEGASNLGRFGVANRCRDDDDHFDFDLDEGQFGAAKRSRDNDVELHENRTMYSCGSLAPKMSRNGCSDGGGGGKFQRPSDPWEKADGAVHLVSQLSSVPALHDRLVDCLGFVAEACRCRHYVSHHFLVETVMKCLPEIAKNLGVRRFKSHYLELFLDHMFYAAASQADHPLAAAAGNDCIAQFSRLVGPNIFKGRVEQFNPSYLPSLEHALNESGSHHVPSSMPMEVDSKSSLGGTPKGSPPSAANE